jgi:tetratricopeptide (TPR) repeat protein
MPRQSALIAFLLLAACHKSDSIDAPKPPPTPAPRAEEPTTSANPTERPPAPAEIHATAKQPKVTPLPVCRSEGREPLVAARGFYDDAHYEEALSCAAQACALTPDEPQAHSEKAAALSALGRFDEAQLAYARALALDPEHLDALLGAAHLYTVSLPSTRERDELGVLYSERGLQLAEDEKDNKLVSQFALLSAMAFNDLGQARDALDRAEQVTTQEPGNREASYERAVALFELCRFNEAKQAFTAMLDDPERAAHAHHHLGLLLERDGKITEAERHFARARQLAPEDFPEPQILSKAEFASEVQKALKELPADMRRDLTGIPVTAEEFPKEEDLLGGDPPLSPAILGLFRGPPLGDPCTPEDGKPCRSVALYRLNLARAVKSHEELLEQIRVTLLHEVGHLRGEDDFELAARGLE